MRPVDDFMAVFQVPDFVEPYMHHFVTGLEKRLVAGMQGRSMTPADIAAMLGESPEKINAFLEQAYRRHVIDKSRKDGVILYSAGDFYGRLDNFSTTGNYLVIPKQIRRRLDRWCFEEYVQRHHGFKKVIENNPEYDGCHNEWVLLLAEVEEMIDSARRIMVAPCNCKMLADNCHFSREICIFFDNEITDRTPGRELPREEALALVRRLDKEGLMHTGGPYDWKEKGPAVVCNCCTCCCHPFRAALELGTKGKWPRSRYVARYDPDKCRQCGLCAKRCQFGAFHRIGDGVKSKGKMAYAGELCWGCGLCANTCPAEAIHMAPL